VAAAAALLPAAHPATATLVDQAAAVQVPADLGVLLPQAVLQVAMEIQAPAAAVEAVVKALQVPILPAPTEQA
jgi:hypothetical protein